jgi:hypothetical protein
MELVTPPITLFTPELIDAPNRVLFRVAALQLIEKLTQSDIVAVKPVAKLCELSLRCLSWGFHA